MTEPHMPEKRRPTDWETLARLRETAPPLPEQMPEQATQTKAS